MGNQYLLEKYNCENNTIGTYFYDQNQGDRKDFTRCMTPIFDKQKHPLCNTSVVFCVSNKAGHMWWGNSTFDDAGLIKKTLVLGVYGDRPKTFDIRKQILDFFDKNGVLD